MKAVSAQAESCCVYVKTPKICKTCVAKIHTCLTFGPIQLLISFYLRAPWLAAISMYYNDLYVKHLSQGLTTISVKQQ